MFSILVLSLISLGTPHQKFERLLPDEEKYQRQIVEGILHLQEQAKIDGKKLRGTHAKGICARGNFEMYENPGSLRKGIFAHAGIYPATLRFSNAAGSIQKDQDKDIRSLSVSIQMPAEISNPQGRFDFSMNSASTFPINDSGIFAAIMVLAKKGALAGGWEVGARRLWQIKEAFTLGEAQKAPATTAYQNIRYWSGVPFLLGSTQAVKYSFRPCANNTSKSLTKDPDTLSQELNRHLAQDSEMSCFDLEVQTLAENNLSDPRGQKHAAMDWIENATWEWNEKQAPFVKVGRLHFEKNSAMRAEDCEALRFNVNLNTNLDHRGLGSINRGRTWAESASADKR